jgi:hypothetical protein
MVSKRIERSKSPLFGSFLQKLAVLFVLFASTTTFGAGRPSIRVMTFNGNNPWEAMQTFHKPTADGFYKTTKSEAAFHMSDQECNDFLGQHQGRALETMLSNKYITRELYEELQKARVHDMRQYILVTLFAEMPLAEADRLGISEEQRMEGFTGERSNVEMVRIHQGSLFAVRGYDIKRAGFDGFGTKELPLPWENGTIPASLKSVMDRTNLPAAIEFGRALVEKGGPREYFQLMMKVAVSAIAADLRTLGIDPTTVPAMAHAYDPEHARLFSAMFAGRPMTPEMQLQMQADPKTFLAGIKSIPLPKKDGWGQFDDAVIVNSMANMIEQYPVDSISEFSNELKKILPSTVTAEQRQTLIQEIVAASREDYDFAWHDPHCPGQRAPIFIHDFGTGFFILKMQHAIQKVSPHVTKAMIDQIVASVIDGRLSIDPDFGQTDWLDKNIYVAVPPYQTTMDEQQPTLVVSNLDPTVPPKEMPAYLGRILVSVAENIESRVGSLSADDRRFLLGEMNKVRLRSGRRAISSFNLAAILDTYILAFATADATVATNLKVIGGASTKGQKISFNHEGKKIDSPPNTNTNINIKIDLKRDLGIDPEDQKRNPWKYKARIDAFFAARVAEIKAQMERDMLHTMNKELNLDQLLNMFQEATVYRFKYDAVERQRNQLGPAAAHSLGPSYNRQKLLRFYITYQ